MANLSQGDRNIIEKYSLDKTSDHLRDILRKAEESYDVASDDCGQGPQKATSALLGALLLSEAAGHLGSKIGDRDVASDLFGLRRRMQNGDFNYEHYRTLVRLVIRKALDLDI